MSRGDGLRDVCAIFERALDEVPARRDALVATACSQRIDLRRRIARLLKLTQSRRGFLDRSPFRRSIAAEAGASVYVPGDRLGAYRLMRRIGRGGMAEVWLAERDDPCRQRAAVKIIRARDSTGADFATEREILGALAHPGIVRLYEGGIDARGSAYLVMEYIEGEHLTAYCNARRLDLGERLALFLEVCDAVSHAHARRVAHRDLKPANILVTTDGTVKLVDFGAARILGHRADEEAREALPFSPAYAAPEQLAGGRIGTAADVHALGVILFELLTGRLPWASEASSLTLAVTRLLAIDVPAPSRAITRRSPIAADAISRDLDAIVGKALRRDAGARHRDARALADDIRRYLARERLPATRARDLTRRALRTAAPSPSPSRARRYAR